MPTLLEMPQARARRIAEEALLVARENMRNKPSGERFVIKHVNGKLIVRRKADRIVE